MPTVEKNDGPRALGLADLEICARGVKKFRVGGALIAAIPLLLSFESLLAGDSNASLPFVCTSITATMIVAWLSYCAKSAISAIRRRTAEE